jgi:ribulose 1,5-bisphosphate carboxylase large subunit-like protein
MMSNVTFVVTSAGVVILDSGSSLQIGQMAIRMIRRVTDLPVVAVFNSHYHGDHWLGNHAFAQTWGAQLPIHAHRNGWGYVQSGWSYPAWKKLWRLAGVDHGKTAFEALGGGHGHGTDPTITQVLLPAAVPSIVAGLRISAGLGWQSLVGAELIVASSGVGYMMVKGQAAVSTATVMAGMISIGIVGLLIDIALRKLQQHIERKRGR